MSSTVQRSCVPVSSRQFAVVGRYDLLVLGGSLAAVSAAVSASQGGQRVMLITRQMHLGEDRTLTLRWWRDEAIDTPVAEACFAGKGQTTPLRIKKALDEALLGAGVEVLFASAPTELLHDEDGGVAGVVIANRAGRQAVLAPVVIDATQHGTVCGEAVDDAALPLEVTLSRVVAGGEDLQLNEAIETLDYEHADEPTQLHVLEQKQWLTDGSPAALAAIEVDFRAATDRWEQLRGGAVVWHGLPTTAPATPGLLRLPWGPSSTGNAAADQAIGLNREQGEVAAGSPHATSPGTDLRETLKGLRPTDEPTDTVERNDLALPVLADVDLLVVGGGTSGVSAAISGVRQGLRVLVLEYHHGLGGVGGLGLVNSPYRGRDEGHGHEVPFASTGQSVEQKLQWFQQKIREGDTPGDIWYGAMTWGALIDSKPDKSGRTRVTGAAVAMPFGYGVVNAKVVIDATGSADVAIAAGADYRYSEGADDIALQGTGMPKHPLRFKVVNSDYLLIDEHDLRDVSAAAIGVRQGMDVDEIFDGSDFIQNRERCHVVGEFTLSYLDQLLGRTYPDTICWSHSDYDSHGYPTLRYFALLPHNEVTKKKNHPAPANKPYTPYRCLIPKGLEGLLVVGIGISMHRDASAMVRMQRDIHNQAYAAAVAAEQAVREGLPVRDVDIKAAQRKLVDLGILPVEVIRHGDNFPLSDAEVERAVADWVDPELTYDERCRALGVLFVSQDRALPMVRKAWEQATGDARLEQAKLLGFWGEPCGAAEIATALEAADWDDKILQGRMAEYAYLPTPVDAMILALGYSGDADAALPVLLAKLPTLGDDDTLSHHRSLALALEALRDPRAAKPLADMLNTPGLSGHAVTSIGPLPNNKTSDRQRRGNPMRELTYARALYRCGDHDGLGETILKRYTQDLRGLFARHAKAVLTEPIAPQAATPATAEA